MHGQNHIKLKTIYYIALSRNSTPYWGSVLTFHLLQNVYLKIITSQVGIGANASPIHYTWACSTFHLLISDPVNETKFRALDVTITATLTRSKPPKKAKVMN